MAIQFKLAGMGHTMETGRVFEWHVSEGESIDEGQLLISIETDKTVVDVNSPVSGVLLKAVGQVDAEYNVGDLLAWIGDARKPFRINQSSKVQKFNLWGGAAGDASSPAPR
ncbi:MAG: hypothetical protein CM1200mP18_11110 [Gammaproteobacteria bacterium]|nr:MAG: hypothetical protein CM1200mP18_11110 [Gammaproteobacteria bacterium]